MMIEIDFNSDDLRSFLSDNERTPNNDNGQWRGIGS